MIKETKENPLTYLKKKNMHLVNFRSKGTPE